ncbi:hypothetical protein PRZ48_005335 [Zasmidium cellare]|uniref:FAD-binding domain-containing protein n=1 Tax=Zasmidium cellare TaxID=395010 RepID=A0ABR0ESQ3_ZASCE|nr:hypothetical protein PRZ48_005335 [Zasmidium cellare]
MAGLEVLISGAGIAGPATAFFLAKAGAKVTVVERAPEPRTGGQNVDVRGHGLTIIRRMGLEETVRSKTTHEKGLRFVDARDIARAEFPIDDGQGFTSDIEIMRGDLGLILYEATRDKVQYMFGENVKATSERSEKVEVEFENGSPTRSFDVVIAADGWSSTTRRVAFDSNKTHDSLKDLGQWAAWFRIPHQQSDSDWARWYNAPGKRMILLRPDNARITRASLWVMPSDDQMDKVAKQDVQEQKAYWSELFHDAGWEAKRVVEGMQQAGDFYMQKIAQVSLPRFSSGRTVLVGDAGYCPSPITGMGTTAALVGAYILAGELVQRPKEIGEAFRVYEDRMKPFVKTAQKLAPGAPSMANPQTQWGIQILHCFLGFIAWSGILKWMGPSFNPPATGIELPEYTFA